MNDAYINTDIKKQDFFETIYGALFYPRQTFEEIRQNPPIIHALGIVILISVLNPIINASFLNNQNLGWFVYSLFSAGLGGIIKWVFFAAFIEALASIFRKGGNFKIFLALSAFALLPWVFIGPVTLLKSGGILTGLIGILFGIAIWVWSTVLTVFAVMKSYEISSGRVLLLISIPLIGAVIFFNWIIGFFTTLTQILKF
ncbi:MAG TPA: Yip1 family protein [Candidatus Gastranaerophilales bacterium]|nr:Yip1 family protein [Candidatus Gastranaerophilales bacterium]